MIVVAVWGRIEVYWRKWWYIGSIGLQMETIIHYMNNFSAICILLWRSVRWLALAMNTTTLCCAAVASVVSSVILRIRHRVKTKSALLTVQVGSYWNSLCLLWCHVKRLCCCTSADGLINTCRKCLQQTKIRNSWLAWLVEWITDWLAEWIMADWINK